MLRFALPLVPAALATWVLGFSDRYFLRYYGNNAEVGLYQVGLSVAMFLVVRTCVVQLAWSPYAYAIHREPNASRVYSVVFLAYVWAASAASAILALFAPEAISLVATQRYSAASSIVGILCFGYLMIGLGYITGLGCAITKTTVPSAVAVFVAAIVSLLGNFLLVPLYGKTGAAISNAAAQTVIPALLLVCAQRRYPIPYKVGTATVPLFLLVAFIILFGIWQPSSFWVGISLKTVAVCSFIPAAILFNVFKISWLATVIGGESRASSHGCD